MKIQTLEKIDTSQILQVFNESFADYLVPMKLTEEQLEFKMRSDKTDKSLSVMVQDGEKPVAFILHGKQLIDGKLVVYNGGTGVIPENRKSGWVREMYDLILPVLKEQGAEKLVLEVITENVPAIKSYEKFGYTVSRKLKCYRGDINIKAIKKDAEIREVADFGWAKMKTFWDVQPTWQNSINVLEEIKEHCKILGAFIGGQLVGYLVFNPEAKKIYQLAVIPEHRRKGIGTQLLAALKERVDAGISVINVDESSVAANKFLQNSGLSIFIEQYEMTRAV
ncbi:GNAT family acetyltransferase [Elizabethkingia miricola]|uniref:GNAT family acetyltransferase n=1 Tax=Elizabethkingia miricola TaxID=172045 RepID=A0ABD4DJY3_ELIMR|nr:MULTISPECIES: GNAT family N-acetyltransferase [Elizabethkingia]KUY17408.1 GNAT family acetyltransferase [Elizabethkingia miricola]MCL1652831.1 GNAT family N-acetyltransferase [Elizabethkingia miricola]OPC68464.1 GNAT family acetyltransferase [Elizabethkingia miricola]OPC75537.1 GNAT family acetyltransferase [Elizabethkingia miricola]QCO47973.1 GNAT family N-acetyltransferase [Elizabethkingia sp. 2-6]